MLVFASGSSPAAPPGTASVPAIVPSVTPTVLSYDQQNVSRDVFAPGQTEGRVYFGILDPNDDPALTVQIFDTNASRDGLASPVATWTVNLTKGWYFSTQTGLEYTLPTSLVYGGGWNVSVSGSTGGNVSYPFLVRTYGLLPTETPNTVLAGHSGSIQFAVVTAASGAPYTQISSVNLSGEYYDGFTSAYAPLPLSVSSFGAGTTQGAVSYLLPINATNGGEIDIAIWANVTSSGNLSVRADATVSIANFDYAFLGSTCQCVGNAIQPNSQVVLYAYVTQSGDEPAFGVNVSFAFWAGTTPVPNSAVPGNPPANLTTDSQGYAEILFLASPSVFSTSALNQVNVTVQELPSFNGSAPLTYNLTFDFTVLTSGSVGATISVTFSAPLYFGGETGTATWQVQPAGGGTHGWTAVSYALAAYYDDTWNNVATGVLSGLSGTISFTAPAGFSGTLRLTINAQNQSDTAQVISETQVQAALIVLTPSEVYYNPGDTIQVTVQSYGSILSGATFYWGVSDYESGTVLASGTVTGTTFSFVVPSTGVPTELYVYVYAQTPALGLIAGGTAYLTESYGVSMNVGISTVSQYSDGSYQPGQTLTITWSVSLLGGSVPTVAYYVGLYTVNGWDGDAGPVSWSLTSATSGSIQYTVPSGTSGTQTLYLTYGEAASCSTACYAVGQVSFLVNPSPSVLTMELGAGSGLTVGWLILLLVIVVVAVLLLLVMRRGRTPKNPPSTYVATTGTMSPPAPAPSTPPAAEWRESPPPPTTGEAPPPLPNPPSGAQ
jgi:hypothetical protein